MPRKPDPAARLSPAGQKMVAGLREFVAVLRAFPGAAGAITNASCPRCGGRWVSVRTNPPGIDASCRDCGHYWLLTPEPPC